MDAADIVDVVKEFVTLRKAGVNYKGLCPFHDEKTPSFVVSPAKQLCKCFSCRKGGNAVHFVMEHEQMSYPEALKWLAKKYGIEVKERELSDEEKVAATARESMFVVNEWARDYFSDILHNNVDGISFGKAYFRQRGFRDDIIKKFQLGFALPGRDVMSKTALSKGFSAEYLEKTGLSFKTEDGRLLDRYHGRVIFPVHTVSGRVVAFGGRILTSDKKLAKYVNSPESEIYSKSRELYGLYFAKSAIVKHNRCYLVEGYTDVISMHQSGIENVVASSGTSLTSGQVRLIHRFTDNITVLYDGDSAGIKASLRGIDMLLAEGLKVNVLLLPDGDDPDSFARKHNATDYQAYIDKNQVDFIKFKINLLKEDAGDDPIKRAELIQEVVRSISVVPNDVVRQMYIKECASLLEVDEALVVTEIRKVRAANKDSKADSSSTTEEKSTDTTTSQNIANASFVLRGRKGAAEERLLMEVLIKYGDVKLEIPGEEESDQTAAKYIEESLREDDIVLSSEIYNAILREAAQLPMSPEGHSLSYFINHPNAEVSKLAAELGEDKYQLSTNQKADFVSDRDRLFEVVQRLVHDYKHVLLKLQIADVMQQLKDPAIIADPNKFMEVMKCYKELLELQQEFAKFLGNRVVLK
jgi:DNA primase